MCINPLNAELNPICHLLALQGGATIVVVSRLRVKLVIGISLYYDARSKKHQNTTLTLIVYIAYHSLLIHVSFLRDKLAYVHPCGSIRGPGDGRRLFVGRLLTKAVVLPQTMQSPSHYSAVFRREAANITRALARSAGLLGRRRGKRDTLYSTLALHGVHVT